MPHKPLNPEKLLLVEQSRDAFTARPRQPPKRKVARRLKRPRRVLGTTLREDRRPYRGPSIMRIRRLIMAALRVWELKNGIHEMHWIDFDQPELLHPLDDF